jgi:type II secretory pathway component PulK
VGTVLIILILVGAALSLVAAAAALRAYLRYRRARRALQYHLVEEVARLSERTAELEQSLSSLDARAQELPIRISELQQSLTTLRVLTGALGASLAQAQKVLSFSALKTLSSTHLAGLLPQRGSGRRPPPADTTPARTDAGS